MSLTAFNAAAMRRAVAARRVDAIYCFSGQMAQYLPAGVPAVMDFVDVDSAKFAQFADAGSAAMRWMMRREARLLGAFERQVSASVRASLFVSEAEAALFRSGGGAGRIVAVENGIDAAAFDPAGVDAATQGPLLVFTGQMDYRPNVEAVAWFAAEVMPRLRQTHPGVRFAIVGRAPTAAVQALAAPDVIVTGAVDDVRPWLAAASVCVAPLHLARGIQNKVLEAMAMARPVVASPAAAEGIDHAGTLRVAGSAAEQARAIGALLDDPDAASALAMRRGRACWRAMIGRRGWHRSTTCSGWAHEQLAAARNSRWRWLLRSSADVPRRRRAARHDLVDQHDLRALPVHRAGDRLAGLAAAARAGRLDADRLVAGAAARRGGGRRLADGRCGFGQLRAAIGVVLMLQGAVVTLLGAQVARGLLFPLAYALFLVPSARRWSRRCRR